MLLWGLEALSDVVLFSTLVPLWITSHLLAITLR
jgi:hypothetical protein